MPVSNANALGTSVAPPTDTLQGAYYDFVFPLQLVQLLNAASTSATGAPLTLGQQSAQQQWLSLPRSGVDRTVEVISVSFQSPVSISDIGFEIANVPCKVAVWYESVQGTWSQVYTATRTPLGTAVSGGAPGSWSSYRSSTWPIIARALQFRFVRVPSRAWRRKPYSVGLRNTLIQRIIHSRGDAIVALDTRQDSMGNIIASTVADWSPVGAIDDDPRTFWKSSPQPAADAVVTYYCDLRNSAGAGATVDALYIDPVYDGQQLNLYYSNDDTVGVRALSAISAPLVTQQSVNWAAGVGLTDVSTPAVGASSYLMALQTEVLYTQPVWIGVSWTPDFDVDAPPPDNIVLFTAQPPSAAAVEELDEDLQVATPVNSSQYYPTLWIDTQAMTLNLRFENPAGATIDYQTQIPAVVTTPNGLTGMDTTPSIQSSRPMAIVAGWSYSPSEVYLAISDQTSPTPSSMLSLLVQSVQPAPSLPAEVSLSGQVGFRSFHGTMTSLIVKVEEWPTSSAGFLGDPALFCLPQPQVSTTVTAVVPSGTLDNAILCADWTVQDIATGGVHQSLFSSKLWTPIWSDYTTRKGHLLFPQPVTAKYLALEFTKLTPEPYPIYNADVEVVYQKFPAAITAQTPGTSMVATDGGGLLGASGSVLGGGSGVVNWMSPQTIINAVGSTFGQTTQQTMISSGPGVGSVNASNPTFSIPNLSFQNVNTQQRTEVSSAAIYHRPPPNPTALVGQVLTSATKAPAAQLPTQIPLARGGDQISDSFHPLVRSANTPAALPQQGSDWWVTPGGTMRIPAAVMTGLTGPTLSSTARASSFSSRPRFATTCVHEYQTVVATQNSGVAYFAGLREIQPLNSIHTSQLDPPFFEFNTYDLNVWHGYNVAFSSGGALGSTLASSQVLNPQFDSSIDGWTVTPESAWNWDPNTDVAIIVAEPDPDNPPGEPLQELAGSMHVSTGGAPAQALSSSVVLPPDTALHVSVQVFWKNVQALTAAGCVTLAARYFDVDGSELSGLFQAVTLSQNDWSISPSGWQTLSLTTTTPSELYDHIRFGLDVNDTTAGDFWFDDFEPGQSAAGAYVALSLQTHTGFLRLACDFYDSGLLTSDGLWASSASTSADPQLSSHAQTVPAQLPGGMWSDAFSTWESSRVAWSSPQSAVSIQIDPGSSYQGRQVLRLERRNSDAELGVEVRQESNLISSGLFRIHCDYYKPTPGVNQLHFSLNKVTADPAGNALVFEESIFPNVGAWSTYTSRFVEIPQSDDQVYLLKMVVIGAGAEGLYVADLYCEVANIRYTVTLGSGVDQPTFDVTELRYSGGETNVVSIQPVNSFSVQATVLGPNAWLYGCRFVPRYLGTTTYTTASL